MALDTGRTTDQRDLSSSSNSPPIPCSRFSMTSSIFPRSNPEKRTSTQSNLPCAKNSKDLEADAFSRPPEGLEFSWKLAADVPPILIRDPARLRQVLINLIGNAIKFTEQGGIDVDIRAVSRNEKILDLRFRVADTRMEFHPKNRRGSSKPSRGQIVQPPENLAALDWVSRSPAASSN